MKRAASLLIILSILLGLLSGCGQTPAVPEESEETPTEEQTVETAPEETVVVDPTPELMRVITREPEDLDPVSIRSDGKSCLLEVYEPLFARDGTGGTWEAILADPERGEFAGYDHAAGTAQYTIYLREGIRDHAGNTLTAADAVFCYQRLAEAEGWSAWARAEAVDETQLTLVFNRELNGPGELASYLCDVYLYTQAAYEAQGAFLDAACGTGPYTLASFHAGESLKLAAWDEYWQDESVRPARAQANVRTIEYLFIQGTAARVIALETFQADMADCLDYADTRDFRGEGVYTDMYRVESSAAVTNDILIANVGWQSIMKDSNLRLGVFYAIDNQQLAECFGEGGGQACFAVGNPSLPDMPESWRSAENYETVTLDVDAVRRYLREAAYVNESFTLLVTQNSSAEQLGAAIQAMLRPMSITVNVVAVPAESFDETLADAAAWDLAIVSIEAEDSVAEVWKKLWTDRYSGGYYPGALQDSTLTTRLQAVAEQSGCTEENLTAVMEHITSKAYAMGLAQKYSAVVVPLSVTQAYITGQGELLPGACLYY